MIPDAASLARKQYRSRKTLRFIAFVLFAVGSGVFVFWIITALTGFFSEDHGMFWSAYLMRGLSWTATYWFLAAAIVLAQRPLVRWLVPRPQLACPICSYRLEGLTVPRCPECGLTLTHEFLPPRRDAE